MTNRFLAIREDGMPGGRNKSIGPVTLNEEEIERVLNGTEFELERRKFFRVAVKWPFPSGVIMH